MGKLRELTQQERAAMWLYHEEYARLGIGAIEFYRRLGAGRRRTVDDMIKEICDCPKPKKE